MRARRRVIGRRSSRQPDGDRLEPRTLLSATPLSSAVPLHFGVLNLAEESHFLSHPGDVDFYSVALDGGEEAHVSIEAQQAGSGLTSLLRVFDSHGAPL